MSKNDSGVCECFQQKGNWFSQAGKTFFTELFHRSENLSSKCLNQGRQMILTTSQFAWWLALNKTPLQIIVAVSV